METATVEIGRSPERLILTDVQRGPDGVAFSMVVGVELGSLTTGREVVAHSRSGFADLPVFFADLAENWRGWSGTRTYESLEHDFLLEAVHTGSHVELSFTLQDPEFHGSWSVRGRLTLDAGEELTRVSADLKELLMPLQPAP
jgi:hypothetical protein